MSKLNIVIPLDDFELINDLVLYGYDFVWIKLFTYYFNMLTMFTETHCLQFTLQGDKKCEISYVTGLSCVFTQQIFFLNIF